MMRSLKLAALKVLVIVRRFNIRSALAIAGILGPLILTAGDLIAALANTDYNLVRDSISSLALTQFGWLQTIGFLALGLLVEIFTAGLLFNIKRARGFHLGIGILVFFGFGMLLIGAFHTDPVGIAQHTIEGRIHSIMATTSFWLFPFAVLFISPSLKNDKYWKVLFRFSIVICILSVIFIITLGFQPDNSPCFGLVERILVAIMLIWVEAMAINLLHISVTHKQLEHKQETR